MTDATATILSLFILFGAVSYVLAARFVEHLVRTSPTFRRLLLMPPLNAGEPQKSQSTPLDGNPSGA